MSYVPATRPPKPIRLPPGAKLPLSPLIGLVPPLAVALLPIAFGLFCVVLGLMW